jgi:hypothetical protein
MTITHTAHNIEINAENSIEYWSREEDSDGIHWRGTEKHFRKLSRNNFWEERPNNGWAKCSVPLVEGLFQEWLRNHNNPKTGYGCTRRRLGKQKSII